MSKLNLRQKLAKIRESIEYLQKNVTGNQGASYVDSAVLLKKIRTSMNEYGVVLSTSIIDAQMSLIHQPTNKNANQHDHLCCMKMLMVWLDTDSDEKIEVPWFATGSHMKDPSMAMGGGLTYTERYFFLKYFNIPTAKDDPEWFENRTKEPEPPPKPEVLPGTKSWDNAITAYIRDGNLNKVEERAIISEENKQLLIKEANGEN